MRMRILLLANSDIGLYTFRRELIEFLIKKHELFFCVPYGEFVERISELGCKFIQCDALDRRGTNPVNDLRLLQFYLKLLKDIRPDLVLTYTIKSNVYGGIACQKLHVPYIANVTGLGTSIENGGVLSCLSISLYKIGLHKANCVFFQNKSNQSLFLERKIINGRTVVTPGSGVNLKKHRLEPYPSESDGIRFLFVGRIMKDKGIEEILNAIKLLHNENKKVILDIVGWIEEEYSKPLEEAEAEGAICFHGFQANVHTFYSACHCAVLPSYHEGMANAMLEASSTGRPVITTRVPGCRETFDEGVTGFGCDVKSTESLIMAMRKFLALSQEERKQMGIAARQKMEREYDRNIVLNAYNEEMELIVHTL